MIEFSVNNDMKSMLHEKGGDRRESSGILCLTLIIKDLKINVE